MADVNANIGVNIDTSAALANLKALQRQISAFHTSMAKSGAAASAVSAGMQQNLINSINQTGKFSASMRNIRSTTESFTNALEKNKLSMREYFRYAGASTKSFGRLFTTEFNTIEKVARERVKTLQTQYIKMGRDANGAMRAIAVRPLALDMENLATRTQIAAQKQALFNQLVKQGSTQLLNFGKNTQWAGRQLMVGFTVPLTMLGVAAGRTFMQLEEQAIRFRRVYGETFTASSETEKMLEQIRGLAQEFTKYGVAVEKTMEMAATAAASGKMGAELLAQVSQATRLAVLGGVEQEQALETTISLTNAFGLAAEDLTKKINFLNAVENQTVVSIEDLTIAIPKAAPVIKQLGGNVEDLSFFLTAMKEGGINASEGANALKSGLAALINPTGKAAEMLQSFGINIQGIVEANKGDVKGLVIDFAKALDTLDPLTRARAIEQLFGKFQFSRLSTLFKNVIQEGSQASRVLKLTAATTEELAILSERELARIENTTTYKFKKAMEDLKSALAPVGEEFLKALTPVIEIGTKILKAFDNLDSGTKTFIVSLVSIAGVIGPAFLMTFGLIANGFANLIKMFSFIGRAFGGVKGSTTDLAAQTQYMTQEQLEAAAVAASLDQTHMKLRQTFTSEAGAVNLLTQAYQRATTAQAAFNTAAVARTRPGKTKGYASGVVSVPGPKGAGDIVPAMLSPGEAIIPAKQASKYSGLISSMISGNIPGYEKGTVSVSPNGKNINFAGISYETKTIKGANTLAKTIAMLQEKGKTDMQILERLNYLAQKTVDRGSNFLTGKDLAKNFNLSTTGKELFRGAGKSSSPQSLTRSLQPLQGTFFDERKSLIRFLRDSGVRLSKTQIQNLLRLQASHILPAGAGQIKDWSNLKNLMPDLGYVNNYLNRVQKSLGKGLLGMSETQLTSLGINRGELEKLVSGQHPTTKAAAKTMQAVAAYDARLNNNYQAKVASFGLGQRLSAGYYTTSNVKTLEELKQSGVIRSTTGARKPPKTRVVGGGAADNKIIAVSKGETILSQQSTKAMQRGQSANIPGIGTIGRMGKFGPMRIPGAIDGIPEGQTQSSIREGIDKRGRAYYYDEVQKKRISAKEAANIKLQEQNAKRQSKLLDQQEKTSKPKISGRVMGGIGAAATIGVMGASMMGGQVGDIANQLMMPVMMLSSMLPMLSNPIGIAVAAIGGLAVAAFALNAEMEKQRKEHIALGNATVMSLNSLEKLSEDLGTVSITEQRKAKLNSQIMQIDQEQISIGKQFITETASGQQILADVNAQLKSGVSSSEISTSLSTSLATAVQQGVMDQNLAQGIIAAVAESTGQLLTGRAAARQLSGYLNGGDISRTALDTLSAQQAKFSTINFQKTSGYVGGKYGIKQPLSSTDTQTARTTQIATMNTYGQAVGGIDIVNAQYDQLIEKEKTRAANQKLTQKELEDSLAKIEEKRDADLQKQIDAQNQVFEEIKKQKAAIGEINFNSNFLESIKQQFGEDSPIVQTANQINAIKDSDFKTRMQVNLQSGTMSAEVINKMMEYANSVKGFKSSYNLSITASGQAATDQAIVNMMAAGKDGIYINAVLDITEKNPEALKNINTVMDRINEINANGGTINIASIDFKDTKKMEKLTKDYAKIDKLAAKGPITLKAVTEMKGFEDLKVDVDWFNKLDDSQKKQFITEFITLSRTVTDAEISAWKAKKAGIFGRSADYMAEKLGPLTEQDRQDYAAEIAKNNVDSNDQTTPNDPNAPGGNGGDGISALSKKIIKAYEAKLKAINKERDALREVNQELERRKKFEDEQMQRAMSMKQAFISGNYIQASMIKQNMAYEKLQFDKETEALRLEERIKTLEEKISRLQDGKKPTKADRKFLKTRNFAMGGLIKKYAGGGLISGPGTGTSDSILAKLNFASGGFINVSNGEFIQKASAVQRYGTEFMNSVNNETYSPNSSIMYNVSMTINGGNADASEIANKVMQKLNTISVKNNKSNRVNR